MFNAHYYFHKLKRRNGNKNCQKRLLEQILLFVRQNMYNKNPRYIIINLNSNKWIDRNSINRTLTEISF